MKTIEKYIHVGWNRQSHTLSNYIHDKVLYEIIDPILKLQQSLGMDK